MPNQVVRVQGIPSSAATIPSRRITSNDMKISDLIKLKTYSNKVVRVAIKIRNGDRSEGSS